MRNKEKEVKKLDWGQIINYLEQFVSVIVFFMDEK